MEVNLIFPVSVLNKYSRSLELERGEKISKRKKRTFLTKGYATIDFNPIPRLEDSFTQSLSLSLSRCEPQLAINPLKKYVVKNFEQRDKE